MTELGEAVNEMMKKNFPEIVDVNFTAGMEKKLDGVADGTVQWKSIIEALYPDLDKAVAKAKKELEKVEIAEEETDVICENCGRHMVIKYGPHGKFWPAPDSRSVATPNLILKRSELPVPSAEAILLSERRKKDADTTAASIYPTVTSWYGRSRRRKNVLTAED